jgi:uncharacterized membrane protein YqaE (UPF0057 family)
MKKYFVYSLLISVSVLMVSPSYASLIVPAASYTTEPDPAKVKAALAEFKNLSKKERKERIKEAKNQLKVFKKEKKENKSANVELVVLVILAILLPPLAVYLHQGEINSKFWISLLLTLLFILPGIIYALLVVTDSL